MFQHLVITPKGAKAKNPAKHEEPEEIELLSLAPFTANPKLSFEDVKVGISMTKRINIRNPTGCDIMLYLLKAPPDERNVKFNWQAQMVHAASQEMFEITWMPLVEGAWRDIIQLSDNGRIRRDIPIAFKSIRSVAKKKKVVVKMKKVSPAKKSPKKRLSSAPPQRKVLKSNNTPQITLQSPLSSRRSTYDVQTKENFLPLSYTKVTTTVTKAREDTYTLSKQSASLTSLLNKSSKIIEEKFDDSLEANPAMQKNQSLQNINWPEPFTPLRQVPSFCCSTGEKSLGHSQLGNISAETYIKGNTSGGTYVKDTHLNASGDTYVKANVSGGTYVKDSSIANLSDLQFSPLEHVKHSPKHFSLSNFVLSPCAESPLMHRDLGKISEESSMELTPIKAKLRKTPSSTPTRRSSALQQPPRKVNLTYEHHSPAKAAKKQSPVKRLSKGYGNKSLSLKQFVKTTSPKINTTAVTFTSTHNPDLFYNNVCNPYILAQTSGVDPFIAVTMYYDPQWMDEQIARFKNWLNVLLTPPKDLDCKNVKIDVAKMWQECRNKDVEKAPTKEQVSCKYNTNHLLQTLRHRATKLYRSPEMICVLSKCHGMVENNKFTIRIDKDLHRDVGLQKEILRLFFCYNPLWLRIGLEQVYSVQIHLRSNSDVLGLSRFLAARFFSNPYLLRKYKHKTAPLYTTEMKKDALKKFLSLIYFLDQAKAQKLIPYDPCLFSRNAPIKESKEILLRFSSELFHAVGDVTKPLKIIGYVLQHQQTFIHEFEYGVESLGMDLKDGVRLTRVMEIILLEPSLTNLLRVPAISRLQKVYNVKLAFDALRRCGYTIESQIEPKDIVEGHREKTLSFLWQIIYKFQSPRFTKAVITVQTWWRSPPIQRKLQTLREQRLRKENAAIVIQKWYKRQTLRHRLQDITPLVREIFENIKLNKAAVKIQAQYRMFKCRRWYLQLKQSALVIQKHFRWWYQHSHLRKKKNTAAVIIQNAWRTYSTRKRFVLLKQSVAVISTCYSATKQMKQCRNEFVALRSACILIQRRYRATMVMREVRCEYLQVHSAVCIVQARWQATLCMREVKEAYLQLKNAVIIVQRRYRAQKAMKHQRRAYLQLKESVLCVQGRFRTKKVMREYANLKNAAMFVQMQFRAILIARKVRTDFITLKNAVVLVQRKYRAQKAMTSQRDAYVKLKQHVLCVQRRFRANKATQLQRAEYLRLRNSVLFVQRKFRANVMARQHRERYNQLKNAVRVIETRYRARRQMQQCRNEFNQTLKAVIVIQGRFRALLEGRKCRKRYVQVKKAVLVVEARFEALKLMRLQRRGYLKTLLAVVLIQRKVKAHQRMLHARGEFVKMQEAATKMQITFRAHLLRKAERSRFLRLRQCVIYLQRKWRATMEMQMARARFKIAQQAIVKIQRWYRGVVLSRTMRQDYLELRRSVVVIQRRFKATLAMREQRSEFETLLRHVVQVQRRFRANQLMKRERMHFVKLRDVVLNVQGRFRANLLMKVQRKTFLKMRLSAVKIQQYFIGYLMMQQKRAERMHKIRVILLLQAWGRGCLARRKFAEMNRPEVREQRRLERLRKAAATKIQAAWRGYMIRSRQTMKFIKMRKSLDAVHRNSKPEDTLHCRTRKNIMIYVHDRKNLLQWLQALQELERMTRLSQQSCMSLGKKNVCIDLYEVLLRTCRSRIDMEVSSAITGLLINISKFKATNRYAWIPECMEKVLNLMVGCCDKEFDLFPKFATLLWVFAHNAQRKEVLARLPNFAQQLGKILLLCERQQKMVSKSYKGKNASFFAAYVKLPLPLVKPDWGLDYPHAPYLFTNSVHAIRALCAIFDV